MGGIGVNSYSIRIYGNMPGCGARKNKANLFVLRAACCVLRKAILLQSAFDGFELVFRYLHA